MALKLKLAPGEPLYISGALLRNTGGPCEIEVLNHVPLLREKEFILEKDAKTPCERFYLLVQTLYLETQTDDSGYQTAKSLASLITEAAPSTTSYFDRILPLIAEKEHYRALRETRKLMDYEQELIRHAK